MAKRERIVGLTVKAKDQFSSTYRKLEQAQNKATAAAQAASRREAVGAAKDDIAAAIENYKRLAAEIQRYQQVQTNALQTGNLTAAEMKEVGDAIKLLRDRASEAIPVIQQKRQALAALNGAASGGFAAFSKSAEAMQQSARSATASAAADQRAAAAAKLKVDIQSRLNNEARSGFAGWSQYVDTVNRIQSAEQKSASAAKLKAEIQARLNSQAKSGFTDWSRYASVSDRVKAEDERAAAVAQRRLQVQERLNAIGNSGFGAWSRYADTIVRIRTADEQAAAIAERKATIQSRLNTATQSGFLTFSRMASEIEGSAGATARSASASASATTELKKLDTASKAAAASQKGLKSSIDAATSSMGRQGTSTRKTGQGAAGAEADVSVYGLKPWQLVNLGYQVNDVVSGLAMGQAPLQVLAQQAGQFAQIWPEVMVGLARSIPQLTALTAVLSPFIAAALRLKEAGDSVEYFNSRLNASADGYRYTAEGLAQIASQIKDTGISIDDARKMVAGFSAKGISSDQFSGLAQMAKDLSALTGANVADAGSKLADAFSGSIDNVRELDKELNFLTASQYEQIRSMEAAGDKSGALALAQMDLQQRLASSRGETGEWALAAKELAGAWDDLVTALEKSGVIAFVVREIGYAGRDLKNIVRDVRTAANAIGNAIDQLSPDERIAQLQQQIATEEALRANGGLASGAAGMTGEDNLATMKADLAEMVRLRRENIEHIKDEGAAVKTAADATEAQKKATTDVGRIVTENLADMTKESAAVDETNRQRFIEERLLKARNEALQTAKDLNQDFLGLTKEQTAAISQQAGALYDKQQYLSEHSPAMGSFVDRTAGVESGGNASARNPNSSAVGLGQFIESTWLRMFKQYFPDQSKSMTDAAILALREDSKISRSMIELYAQENAKTLQAAGVAVTDASLYLSHFLGPQGAVAVMTAKADTPVSQLLSGATINANKSVLQGKTAGEVSSWAQTKMGGTDAQVETQTRLADLDLQRVTTQKEYLADYQKRVEQQQFELDLMSKSAREAAIEKAVHEEELKAKEAGVELTKEQRSETEKLAATEFDRQNVNLEVNKLMEQRQALLDRMQMARDTNNQSLMGTTATELEGVNSKLNEAIAKAIEFWQAMGGEGSQNAIMNLQNVQMSIGQTVDRIKTQFLPTAEDINTKLADIGGNAASAFAEALANGKNAADAFFSALQQGIAEFLIDIGKAIVKQALFNILTGGTSASGGVGGGIGGAILGLFGAKHTGGIVGEAGMTRLVNPMVFAGAQRYHGGGIVSDGLARNEVPIIALKDEEVITADDARHSKNGGGGRTAVNLKSVNVFDPADVLEAALATTAGEKIIMNFMSRNAGKVNGALNP